MRLMRASVPIRSGQRHPRASSMAPLPLVVLLALSLQMVKVDHSAAKDLSALAEFVVPAYTAMNFAAVCAQGHPGFLSQTGGARGSALQYAEHVKNEAIASLAYNDAAIVLTKAADAARSAARQELQKLVSEDPAADTARIMEWCESYAKEFIRSFIAQHDGAHATFLENIERTKR